MNRAWYEHRLAWPTGPVPVVIDTDAANQIDDQFALVDALLSPDRLNVEAIYAAPFVRGRHRTPQAGMRASFATIQRLVPLIRPGATAGEPNHTNTAEAHTDHNATAGNAPRPSLACLPGATRWIGSAGQPVPSPAAADLIRRAMKRDDHSPLYVIAIGAITNIASALMIAPRLRERIVVVWLAGQPLESPDPWEYNLAGDPAASRFIFDCGVPVVRIACHGVAQSLRLTGEQVNRHIAGRGPIGDELARLFFQYDPNHPDPWKIIWDLAPVGWLIDAAWLPGRLVPTPRLADDLTWQAQPKRYPMRIITACHAEPLLDDLFEKLQYHAKNGMRDAPIDPL